MERRIQPIKKTLRRELECYVIGWNKILRDTIKSMDIVTLLRNAHPAYRPSFANQCQEAGMITEWQASEFRIGSVSRQRIN